MSDDEDEAGMNLGLRPRLNRPAREQQAIPHVECDRVENFPRCCALGNSAAHLPSAQDFTQWLLCRAAPVREQRGERQREFAPECLAFLRSAP
jgi:hypothetical protein